YGQVSTCNTTFTQLLPDGTIHLNSKEQCTGIVHLPITLTDNDQHPAARLTNHTIRLILYSDAKPWKSIVSQSLASKSPYEKLQDLSFQKLTTEIIIACIVIIILISLSC
ncbi:unnamed protein product, partial [Adineta ricciae]